MQDEDKNPKTGEIKEEDNPGWIVMTIIIILLPIILPCWLIAWVAKMIGKGVIWVAKMIGKGVVGVIRFLGKISDNLKRKSDNLTADGRIIFGFIVKIVYLIIITIIS